MAGSFAIDHLGGREADDLIHLTPKATALVEQRINFTIDRLNAIIKAAHVGG